MARRIAGNAAYRPLKVRIWLPFLSLFPFLPFFLFSSLVGTPSRACVRKSDQKRERGRARAVSPLRSYERNSSWLSTPPTTLSVTLSNSRVTLLPALITSLRNDLLIYRLISRRWLLDASLSLSLSDTGWRAAHICKILNHGWTRDPDRTAITKVLYRSGDRQQ